LELKKEQRAEGEKKMEDGSNRKERREKTEDRGEQENGQVTRSLHIAVYKKVDRVKKRDSLMGRVPIYFKMEEGSWKMGAKYKRRSII